MDRKGAGMNRAFSAGGLLPSGPWGAAPGCYETAPLALNRILGGAAPGCHETAPLALNRILGRCPRLPWDGAFGAEQMRELLRYGFQAGRRNILDLTEAND